MRIEKKRAPQNIFNKNKETKNIYITKLTPQYCSVIHKHKLESIQLATLFFFLFWKD